MHPVRSSVRRGRRCNVILPRLVYDRASTEVMRDSLTRRRPGGNHLHRSSQRDHDPPPRLVNRMVPSHPMAHDVFISYAKGDRPRAAELASALEAHAVTWGRASALQIALASRPEGLPHMTTQVNRGV